MESMRRLLETQHQITIALLLNGINMSIFGLKRKQLITLISSNLCKTYEINLRKGYPKTIYTKGQYLSSIMQKYIKLTT